MYNKSLVTIAQILAAAKRLFVMKSYDEITMTDIAKEANVTKGAIYHHFQGKEELFLKMMIQYLGDLEIHLKQAVEKEGSAKVRLTDLTVRYLSMPLQEQLVIQLVRRDSSRFKGEHRSSLVAAYQAALPLQIETIIADGIRNGEIRMGDARLMSWQFVAIVETSLSEYARHLFSDPREMSESLIKTFILGVGFRR
ncbi:MAG: TetR/AcrR family transcriptional regulator [Chloroflexota bacterium]